VKVLALIDGEHYPDVVRVAFVAMPHEVLGAVLVGGTEKLRGGEDYGVPLFETLEEGIEATGAEAIVDVGARITNMVIHDNGVLRFLRILVMGGEDTTATLERVLEVDHDAAERTKLAVSAGSEANPDAAELVEQRLDSLVEEVRGSLDFYRAQQDATPLARVVVSGGGSQLGPLVERLQAAGSVPVERGRTLAGVHVGRLGLPAEELAELEPKMAIPVGLALGAVA